MMFHEHERDIPLMEESDVVVCGGGPAGVAAAIVAARAGARTQLIEAHGCLGGVWTAGLLAWIIDSANKPGVMQEIAMRLKQRGACTKDEVKVLNPADSLDPDNLYPEHDPVRDWSYDVEEMKLLLEEMCLAAGVRIRLHTHVVAAYCDPSNRLSHVVTESKSGREAWQASMFVDATGDGDVAAQAGCGFDMGREDSGEVQPMSLGALVTGIHAAEVEDYVTEWRKGVMAPKKRLLAEMRRAGTDCSYALPVLFRIRDDLFQLGANQEYHVSALDAEQITQATLHARAEIHRIVRGLRSLGGIWRNLRVVATAEQIGVREGRRIHGRYTVTNADLVQGTRHEDAVCRVTFPVDVHATSPSQGRVCTNEGVRARPYDVPLRALIARDVDALLLAGRCMSGDFLAHASYRVTGNAVAMGQAAGALAARAALTRRLPHDVSWDEAARGLASVTEWRPEHSRQGGE